MNHRLNKLTQREQEEIDSASARAQAAQQQTHLEFNSPEELLRHDAAHTPVPPGIARRLRESAPAPSASSQVLPWWRRWFGRQT